MFKVTKRTLMSLGILVGVAVFGAGSFTRASAQQQFFGAQLSAVNVVPPTNSATTGAVAFRVNYSPGGTAVSIDFVDTVRRGVALRQSHFHCGPAGTNGPVVAFMAGRHDGGVNVNRGLWVRGNLTDGAISSSGTGITNPVTCATANPAVPGAIVATIDDFVQQAIAGNIYVCYHDATFPGGVIRGQIGAVKTFTDDASDN